MNKYLLKIISLIGAVLCLYGVVAATLWVLPPAKADSTIGDDEIPIRRSAIVELGTRYLESVNDRNVLLEALQQAQKEISRLQSSTNCS